LAARPSGAVEADWALSTPANPAAEAVTPRRVSSPRSFSSARETRFWAASAVVPKAAPTERKSR